MKKSAMSECFDVEIRSETAFSRLSEAARALIVSATLGEFDITGPPEMEPEVRAELEQWAAASQEENVQVVAPATLEPESKNDVVAG